MNSSTSNELRRAACELRLADEIASKSDKIDRRKAIGRAAANNLSAILFALDSLSAPQSGRAVFNCPNCPVAVESQWLTPECPECGERCFLDPSAKPAPQSPAEAHCATCSCVPGMTPAVRFDTTPAEKEGAVRDHLIRMGWTPPAEAQPCGCGEATCTVPWEPGCGLGKSEQHAEAQPVAWSASHALLAEFVDTLNVRIEDVTVASKRLKELDARARKMISEAAATTPPSAPVGVEGWRVDPVEDDPDMLAVETPDGRTWFAKRGDRVFELAEALALARQPAPVGVPVDVVREYLDARACYEAATRPPNSHARAPVLKHDDPDALRLREARVALDNAIVLAQQPAAVDWVVRAAVEAEREACAKACDERAAYYHAGDDDGPNTRRGMACEACASVIRWRSTVSPSFLAKHEAEIADRLAAQPGGSDDR